MSQQKQGHLHSQRRYPTPTCLGEVKTELRLQTRSYRYALSIHNLSALKGLGDKRCPTEGT